LNKDLGLELLWIPGGFLAIAAFVAALFMTI
jgi:hypothetical protein